MDFDSFVECLKGHPVYQFSSSYGYMFSFEIGPPHLLISKNKGFNNILEKEELINISQEYLHVRIVGEISFFTSSYWILKYNNTELCNADISHEETEEILSLYLAGHSIIGIVLENREIKSISIQYDNHVFMEFRIPNRDMEIGEHGHICFFFSDGFVMELDAYKGYSYYCEKDEIDKKWKTIGNN